MLLLPKKVGSYTLQRKLGTGGVAESYVGTHDGNAGRPVVVRRVLPYVLRDAARLASVEARVRDLLGVRHPFLVHVLESFQDGEDRYVVEEHIDGVNLEKVLAWCRQNQRHVPHNVFLNIATQVCNGLEALHGRPGKGTSAEHVLHLALKAPAIFVTRDGKVMVGGYGLTRSPTMLPNGGVAGPVPTRMEYLSPEQTHPDQKLTPASDIFSLGAVLYELLTLDSLFRADSNLQTIHRVRRAEVTSQLLRVKELMPGLDKVLYRALSLNPRHRYQRAFVLREDLRGLMAGYSFATIAEDTRAFLAPLLETIAPAGSVLDAAPDAPANADSFAETPITHVDLDPMGTAAAAAERRAPVLEPVGVDDIGEHTENSSPAGTDDPPTEVRREAAFTPREDLDRPTLPGQALADTAPEGTFPVDPRRPPPDPTVSQPDLHRLPPAPPVQLAGYATPEPAPAAAPPPPVLPAPGFRGAPESTAAWIAQDRGAAEPRDLGGMAPVGEAGPSDTAAFIAAGRDAAPAPPPPALDLPPPPTLSRPMPPPGGGPALSRPMPPPAAVGRPVAPTPTVIPETTAPTSFTPAPAHATLTPTPSTPPPADAPEPFEDEPEAQSSRSWIVVGGAMAALVAVLACAAGGYAAYARFAAGGEVDTTAAAVPEPAAPTAPGAPGGDAAAVMADAAPPRLEPVEDGAEADAAALAAAPPVAAEPAEAPAPTPVVAAAPAPTPAPVAKPVAPEAPKPVATPVAAAKPAAPAASAPPRTTRPTTPAEPVVASSTPRGTSAAPTTTRSTVSSTPATTTTRAPATTTTRSPVATTTRTPTTTAIETPPDMSVEETPVSDLEQYVDNAKRGKLQSTDIAVLEMIDTTAPDYTRSRALLLMNAQRKGDDKTARRYLDQLMVLPENQYNPVYLTDYARWHVNHGEYDKALDKATLADRHWARIPPELVFSKRAEIYEIQAAAYQGKFYKSDEDMELLGSAIKGWERYRQHVATKSREDLQKRADAEIARLQDIREKLQ